MAEPGPQPGNRRDSGQTIGIIAGVLRDHPPAAGVAGAIDPLGVNAQGRLQVVDQVAQKELVVGWRPGRECDAGHVPAVAGRRGQVPLGCRHDEGVLLGRRGQLAALELFRGITLAAVQGEHQRQPMPTVVPAGNVDDGRAVKATRLERQGVLSGWIGEVTRPNGRCSRRRWRDRLGEQHGREPEYRHRPEDSPPVLAALHVCAPLSRRRRGHGRRLISMLPPRCPPTRRTSSAAPPGRTSCRLR
jgi:hypothetical protein